MTIKLQELPRPKVKLVGEDGNAFFILGRVRRAMKREGWSREAIEQFTEEATSGDYNNLLGVVLKYCDEDDE